MAGVYPGSRSQNKKRTVDQQGIEDRKYVDRQNRLERQLDQIKKENDGEKKKKEEEIQHRNKEIALRLKHEGIEEKLNEAENNRKFNTRRPTGVETIRTPAKIISNKKVKGPKQFTINETKNIIFAAMAEIEMEEIVCV